MGLIFKKHQDKPLDALGIYKQAILDQTKRVTKLIAFEKQNNTILNQTAKETKFLGKLTMKLIKLQKDMEKMDSTKTFNYNRNLDIGEVDFNIQNSEEIARRTREVLKQSNDHRLNFILEEILEAEKKGDVLK